MRKLIVALVVLLFACGGDTVFFEREPDRCPAENEFWNGDKEVCCKLEDGVKSCPGGDGLT